MRQSTHAYSPLVRQYLTTPNVSPEEELRLVQQWQKERNSAAHDHLVRSHMKLAVKSAAAYARRYDCFDDLISEGAQGLLLAIEKFELERHVRLCSFAPWHIRACVQTYVVKNYRMVRLPMGNNMRTLFFRLSQAKARLGILGDELSEENARRIAKFLNVTLSSVLTMHIRLQLEVSVHTPIGDDGDAELIDVLPDTNTLTPAEALEETKERELRTSKVRLGLHALNAREQAIFIARRLSEEVRTLDDLAAVHDISRERVRQIENRAFEKFKAAVLEFQE